MKAILFIACILSLSFGSTLTKTIRPSNGDYTALNTCLNDNKTMEQDTLLVNCDSSMIDGTAISLTGGYTSAKWIIITGVGAGRCTTGTYIASGYRFEHAADANGIGLTDSANFIFDGLRFKFTQASKSSKVLFGLSPITTSRVIIKNCVLQGVVSGTSNNTVGVYCGDRSKVYILNCVIDGFANGTNTIIGVYTIGSACSTWVVNTTIAKSRIGIFRTVTAGPIAFVNNYISTSSYPIQNFSGTQATNYVKDTTGYGIYGTPLAPFTNATFTDTVNGDYSLVANSTLINKGTNLSAQPYPLNATTDIKGRARSANWDVGAFEYKNAAITFSPYHDSATCSTGVAFNDTLKCTDIPWDSCTVDPIFPVGLSLNKTNGAITGTSSFASAVTYKFWVWKNGIKEDSTTLKIIFYAPVIASNVVQTNRVGIDFLWYGINQYNKADNLTTLTKYINDLNSKIVRFDIYWYYTEPTKGSFDWSKTDSAIAALPSNCQALFTLYCTAQWAIKDRGGLTTIMPPNAPTDYDDYYNFVYALATRYKGRVNYYQIENEVYAALPFWYGTSQEYLTLLQTGYAAVHAADSTAKVLAASVALAAVDITQPVPNEYEDAYSFIQLIYKSGVNYFDIADIHLYYTLAAIPDRFTWFKNIMGVNKKPIWVTETGGLDERAYTNYNDSATQAIDLIKRYTTIFADTVDKAFWLQVHLTKDDEGTPWRGMKLTNDASANDKRLGYYSLKTLISKVDQFTSSAKINCGTKFIVNGKPILVMWNQNDTTVDMSSVISTTQAKTTKILPQNGIFNASIKLYDPKTIPLDSIPVFIENFYPVRRGNSFWGPAFKNNTFR